MSALKSLGLTSSNSKLLLVSCLFLIVAISYVQADNTSGQYSDLPPPPVKPEKFTSKQQLKEYLVKLHEYYAIIGRPRFGRSSPFSQLSQKFHKRPLASVIVPAGVEGGEIEMSANDQSTSSSSDTSIPTAMIVELIDQNNDGYTTKEELFSFLKIFNQKL